MQYIENILSIYYIWSSSYQNRALDSIPVADSNADYLVIWLFFTLFVGVALAIDFGIVGKILPIFRVKNRSRSSDNNTYQRTETSSVLPTEPKSAQQKQDL